MKLAVLTAVTLTMSSLVGWTGSPQQPASAAILQSEFVYETAPFPSVHASTIAETRDGMVALIGVVALFRAFASADTPQKGDNGVLGRFVWLVAAFSSMLLIGVPRG